ncbi:MAG: UDP-N-acetylmuramoyl-tripeptide--D-alanyl-D-alanine ligase [Candidatus Peregrinibacteria bacterium]
MIKSLLKNIILSLLLFRAQKVLDHGAEIIAITGSMGKTTTKNLLSALLAEKYEVLSSREGFNTPIGIALSLVQEGSSGFSSPSKWMKILWKTYTKTLPKPQKIVLEFGVDQRGDMDELLAIAHPKIAIVTNIAPVHLGKGHFRNVREILHEKAKLPLAIPSSGMCLINGEDENLQTLKDQDISKIVWYGKSSEYEAQCIDVRHEPTGISFVYASNGERLEFFLPVIGSFFAELATPVIFLARKYGISPEKIETVFKSFLPSPGRGRILKGKKESILWDQSYNSNPKAVFSALEDLKNVPASRKIVLLGSMNELGEESSAFHEELGEKAGETADLILFVGSHGLSVGKGAEKSGKNITLFHTAQDAGKHLADILQEGDFILIKGSQGGIFLERAVELLLENPEDERLLCRRGEEWKDL